MTEALLALVVDLSIAGAIFLIWFHYKQSKTPEPEEKTKTAEAPTTPAPEKQFPWGLVIGGIVLIIVIIAIASVVSNNSDSSFDRSAEKVVAGNFNLVFEDKFEQKSDNWIVKQGNWQIKDGEFVGKKTQCGQHMWVIHRKKFPGDVILEFDAHTKNNNPTAGIECTIGTDYNSDVGYCFAFGGNSNTKTSILRNNYFMDENKKELVRPGKTYHIKAQRIGGDIALFVDGKRVARFYDSNPLNGQRYASVGLKSYWGWPHVHFDNVRVYTRQ